MRYFMMVLLAFVIICKGDFHGVQGRDKILELKLEPVEVDKIDPLASPDLGFSSIPLPTMPDLQQVEVQKVSELDKLTEDERDLFELMLRNYTKMRSAVRYSEWELETIVTRNLDLKLENAHLKANNEFLVKVLRSVYNYKGPVKLKVENE